MSISPLSMIPQEVHQRVRKLLGEQATGSKLWSSEEIARYVSDSYIEAAKETKALELIELVATTASTATYTLTANVGQIIRVVYDDCKIYNITKWELDRTEPDWENQTGEVSNYITTQMGNRSIRLFKAPEESGGITTGSSGEYGLVIDIDDGTNTYTFDSEYGEVNDTSGTNWDSNFASEYGVMIVSGGIDAQLEVWATKHPDTWGLYDGNTIENYTEQMELPHWSQMGVAFRAAAKALKKYGEQGDEQVSDAYNLIASDYSRLLKGHVGNRSGERTTNMGRGRNKQRRPAVWETLIEE